MEGLLLLSALALVDCWPTNTLFMGTIYHDMNSGPVSVSVPSGPNGTEMEIFWSGENCAETNITVDARRYGDRRGVIPFIPLKSIDFRGEILDKRGVEKKEMGAWLNTSIIRKYRLKRDETLRVTVDKMPYAYEVVATFNEKY